MSLWMQNNFLFGVNFLFISNLLSIMYYIYYISINIIIIIYLHPFILLYYYLLHLLYFYCYCYYLFASIQNGLIHMDIMKYIHSHTKINEIIE